MKFLIRGIPSMMFVQEVEAPSVDELISALSLRYVPRWSNGSCEFVKDGHRVLPYMEGSDPVLAEKYCASGSCAGKYIVLTLTDNGRIKCAGTASRPSVGEWVMIEPDRHPDFTKVHSEGTRKEAERREIQRAKEEQEEAARNSAIDALDEAISRVGVGAVLAALNSL